MRDRLRQIGNAYRFAVQSRPRLPWFLAAALLVPTLLGLVAGLVLGGVALWLPLGLSVGMLQAVVIFGRSIQSVQFDQLEGRPGAAAAIMDQLRGQWFVTPVVAANRKQDMVHRAIGRCGIVLVGEGSSPSRAKALLAQERKRAERVSGDVPVTTLLVGDGEGDTVALDKLQVKLTRLPNELSKTEVPKLARKMAGLDKGNLSMPKGYIPPHGNRPR